MKRQSKNSGYYVGRAEPNLVVYARTFWGHMNKDNLPMDGRWLVHYACPDRTKFAKHTTASYRAMRDHLESLAGRKKDLQKFGQVYGLQYDPNGVLWHPTLRNLICPVQHTM